MTISPNGQYTQLRDMMDDVKSAISRLDTRLDVHDQKHVQLDKENTQIVNTLSAHENRILAAEKRSESTEKDVIKLTENLNKILWAFVLPTIGLVVIALAWAISNASLP